MKKIIFLIVIIMTGLLSGCDIRVLNPASDTATDQAFLIWFSFGLMMLVLIVVFVLMARFVWKYRETENNKNILPKDVKGNKKLELIWTISPILLLAVLAVPTVAVTYNQSATTMKTAEEQENSIHVNVMAQQFHWTFTYENGKETMNELVIPEGKTIVFHLNSKDVIHSFWIPSLGGKTDVLPGKELVYKIEDPELGTYDGKCAEFCGVQHAKMQFTTKVVSQDTYQAWLSK